VDRAYRARRDGKEPRDGATSAFFEVASGSCGRVGHVNAVSAPLSGSGRELLAGGRDGSAEPFECAAPSRRPGARRDAASSGH
jgi:hypothetical protein